jgi:1-acyl-sn-glycerol-3-phosphate acyltransferase
MQPPPGCTREQLVESIVAFVAHRSGLDAGAVRVPVERAIDDCGAGAVEGLRARLAQPSDAWSYYPRDPLAQLVHQRLAGLVLKHAPRINGAAQLDAVRGRAVVIVANHLSYSDANVVEVLLQQAGHGELANRLAVVAGPKIYSDVTRRFSSLCFGTIKSPQNEGVSSGEAAMAARAVAAAARQTIAAAEARLRHGDALLVFPEGTRSRTTQMQPFLPGVSRYFTMPDLLVLPIGLCGTEHMWAIGEQTLGPARLVMQIGRPMTVEAIRAGSGSDRRRFVDRLGRAVAALLPESYRGVYMES